MNDEAELQRLDREWNEAYPRCDTAALGRILADDWTGIDGAGLVIGKDDLLARVAVVAQSFASHEFDEMNLRVFGDAAVSTGRLRAEGRDEDGAFSFRQRFTRVYIKRHGRWQAIATQVTLMS